MPKNFWAAHSEALGQAFAQQTHRVGVELVKRALRLHVGSFDGVAIDVGGGTGLNAIALAKEGSNVTLVEPDPEMAKRARANIAAAQEENLGHRIIIKECKGESLSDCIPDQFDIVCCHSVILYLEDPIDLLVGLAGRCKPGGIISILSINPDATAMREGLHQRWGAAIRLIHNKSAIVGNYLENRKHSLDFVRSVLSKHGFTLEAWYGVGVFTDHIDKIDDFALAIEAEWFAGSIEPYRSIARCYHAVFRSA